MVFIFVEFNTSVGIVLINLPQIIFIQAMNNEGSIITAIGTSVGTVNVSHTKEEVVERLTNAMKQANQSHRLIIPPTRQN